MNKLFKYILEKYNDGSEKVDSSTEQPKKDYINNNKLEHKYML